MPVGRDGRTDCYSIHHDCDLGYTPSHYNRTNRFVFLKCRAEHDETTNIQRYRYVTCPVSPQTRHRAVRATP